MYKLSYYNFLFPLEGDAVLLYNSLSNALCEITTKQSENIKALETKNFSLDELAFDQQEQDILLHNGMVIDEHRVELDHVKDLLSAAKERNRKREALSVVILPTNACNMRCPYCFEGNKPESQLSKIDRSVVDRLIDIFQKALEQSTPGTYKILYVEWYGGEPMMAPDIIAEFSKKLIAFAERNNLGYESMMISNGTLITPELWQMLLDNQVTNVQITLDGDYSTHNRKRPLCSAKDSYHSILKNLQHAPDGIQIPLRINADKEVIHTLGTLFDDLATYGIWPHKAKWVRPYLAHKEYYEGGVTENKELYYSAKEYYALHEQFRDLMVERYNRWSAETGGEKTARKVATYPKLQIQTCLLADQPNGFVIDADGYIHKCMCRVNEESDRMGHINDFNFDYTAFGKWMDFDRLSLEQCVKCKVLPICREDCTQRLLDGKPRCSDLKYFLEKKIISYYHESLCEQ